MSETQATIVEQSWPDGSEPLRVAVPTSDENELIVDVGGFEGPLDLLLELARQHKVDLAQVSILALANQYLAFIEKAQKMRLDVAGDYLVMAAWLAYLKSRLLIPAPPSADGTAQLAGPGDHPGNSIRQSAAALERTFAVADGGSAALLAAAARTAPLSR